MSSSEVDFKNNITEKGAITFEKYFWLLVYFLSPIIPILFIYNSDTEKWSNTTNFISMAAGVSAFVWLAYEFILSARPKFIEKCFGLDKFYIFHGLMAIVSLILVFIHKTLARGQGQNFLKSVGGSAELLFTVIIVLALLFIGSTALLKIKFIANIKKFLIKYSIFKYNNQVVIHNLAIVAYVVMFIHILLAPAVKYDTKVQVVFIIYFLLGAAFYIYHTIVIKILLRKNLFVVKEVVKESENMWTLKLASEKGKMFYYSPGQFGYLKIFSDKIKAEVHPFSISSNPFNKEYISFTIKELGDYTNEIGKVKVGDKAQVDGPYGRFSYALYPKEKATVLISGGIGITPNLGMLRYMNSKDKERSVILLWGINNKKDLIVLSEFEAMQRNEKLSFCTCDV